MERRWRGAKGDNDGVDGVDGAEYALDDARVKLRRAAVAGREECIAQRRHSLH